MRIVIEIDGSEVTAATQQARIVALPEGQAPAPAATGYGAPPAEVLAAAAAVGAIDAGAAPTEAMAPGAPLAPTPAVGPQAVAGEAGDLPAGAAPDAASP